MNRKPLVGISACLLGACVRYDGDHRLAEYLAEDLGRDVEYLPICPEVECGMSIPREPIHLAEVGTGIRLITRETGVDKTGQMQKWIERKIEILSHLPLCGFIFKSRSPSCGLLCARVSRGESITTDGTGLFAERFAEAFPLLPVEEETELHDGKQREDFLDRVLAIVRGQ